MGKSARPAINGKTPCLFLSHSGADTEGARELKRRILASPAARDAGLTVWFDKDDLKAGLEWQSQLEQALLHQATAFAVYIGSKGAVNWVEREVRLGLSRATSNKAFKFIPVLAADSGGAASLPPFAAQHHGVRDPLNDENQLSALVEAALGNDGQQKPVLVEEPFVGLRAMTEAESDRFFGREVELDELVGLMKRHRLVAIVAESGSGKSSLARAGLIPKFRGGALEEIGGREPDQRIRHVVSMRPGAKPLDGLRDGIDGAARSLGRNDTERAALRLRVDTENSYETGHALRCDLPKEQTQTLLLVDQFEELLTQTPQVDREQFIQLLLGLVNHGVHVLATIRADYFNLCKAHASLWSVLSGDQQSAVFRLRGISEEGMEDAVRRPLKMAGFQDLMEQDKLLARFKRDMMKRPGDLALIQMALYATWQRHKRDNADLDDAYDSVGGIAGALANEADSVRVQKLNESERKLLIPLFVRLVRFGETGGVTRRVARLDELDETRVDLARKLATDECSRLLQTGAETVEVSHEALISQWAWLQNEMGSKETATSIRRLGSLSDAAMTWHAAPNNQKASSLPNSADHQRFQEVAAQHPDWLSDIETQFVGASRTSLKKIETRRRLLLAGSMAAALAFGILSAVSLRSYLNAKEATEIAERKTKEVETEKKNAVAQAKIADERSKEAERERANALKERAAAEEQREFAEGAKEIAIEQTKFAQQMSNVADIERVNAEKERVTAERQREAAEESKKIAEEQAKIANQESREAEIQRVTAQREKATAEEQRRLAEASKKVAEEQTKLVRQQAARQSAVVAQSLTENGDVDAAILLLLEGAKSFAEDNLPSTMQISLHSALEQAKRQTVIETGKDSIYSNIDNTVFSLSKNDWSIYKIGKEEKLIQLFPGIDNPEKPVYFAFIEFDSLFIIVSEQGNIFSLNMSSNIITKLGKMNFSSNSKSKTSFTKNGNIIHAVFSDKNSEPSFVNLSVFDLNTNSFSEAKLDSYYNLNIVESTNDKHYLLRSSYEEFTLSNFYVDKDNTIRFEENKYNFKEYSKLPSLCDHVKNPSKKFQSEIAKIYTSATTADFQCLGFGEQVALIYKQAGSGGWYQQVAMLDLEGNFSTDAPGEEGSAGFSRLDVPAKIFTLVSSSSERSSIAVAVKRDVYVAGDDFRVSYRFRDAPASLSFLDETRLVVQETERGRMTVTSLLKENLRESLISELNSKEVPALQNLGSCGFGQGLRADTDGVAPPVELKPGLTVAFNDDDGEKSLNFSVHVGQSKDLFEVKFDESYVCHEFSIDRSEMVVATDTELILYDVEKVIREKSLENSAAERILSQVNSVFFDFDGGLIATKDQMIFKLQKNSQGIYTEIALYKGLEDIVFAEPDKTGLYFLVAENLGTSYSNFYVLSRKSGMEYLNLGEYYKWYYAGFLTDGSILTNNSIQKEVIRIPGVSELLSEARSELSSHCTPRDPRDLRSSPCWPN